jgi:hypothetical protein
MLRWEVGCAARTFSNASDFHGASRLDLVLIIIAVAADATHLVAIV